MKAIFLNNWDFKYVDSLGITTGSSNEDIVADQPAEQDEQDEKPVVDVDARTWIAKGFGLPIGIPLYA